MRVLAGLLLTLAALPTAHAQQLLVIQKNWSSITGFSNATIYRDCIEVKWDASYRFEHQAAEVGQSEHSQIHIGKFSDDEMKQLQGILEAPDLAGLTTPSPGQGSVTWATDLDNFWVAISRGKQPQLLFFDSSTSSGEKKTSGTKLPSLYKTPAMKPLLDWYKQLGKRKNDIDKTATPTCSFTVRVTD
jgi:hypothetical protein